MRIAEILQGDYFSEKLLENLEFRDGREKRKRRV